MPTQIFDISDVPVDLLSANALDGTPLVLEIGKSYSCRFEAIGSTAVLRALEAATGSPPDTNAIGLPVLPYEDLIVTPAAGLAVYVWEKTGAGVLIINGVN